MKCSKRISAIITKVKDVAGNLGKILGIFYLIITILIIILSSITLVYSFRFDLPGKENSYFLVEPVINLSSLDEFIGIGSLVFIIWTFSTGLIVTFLGGINDKRYGIRIIDIVLARRCALGKLIVLSVLFLLELVVLFKAILLKKEITLLICLVMQILWMVYFFLMICIETSERMIQERVRDNTVHRVRKFGNAGPLLYKMIHNLEYEDTVEIEKFFLILESVENKLGDKKKNKKKDKVQNSHITQTYSAVLTECMLKKVNDKRKALSISGSWLRIDSGCVNIKRGILKGILDNAYEPFCPDTEEILDIDFPGKREVLIWAAAYNFFYSDKKVGQGYRTILSGELLASLIPPLNGNDLVELFQIWRGFSDQDDKNSGLIDLNLEALWRLIREGEK